MLDPNDDYEPPEDSEPEDDDAILEVGGDNTEATGFRSRERHVRTGEPWVSQIRGGGNSYAPVSSLLKRSAEQENPVGVLKRRKGLINARYVDILNQEIGHAASRNLLATVSVGSDLQTSRVGMTIWTQREKETFFAALARQGSRRLDIVSETVGTKSEAEVQQYFDMLREALSRRRGSERAYKLLKFSQIPAAVEISQPCCSALEEAADALSQKLEHYEESLEKKKWKHLWEVTPDIAGDLSDAWDNASLSEIKKVREMPFAELFHTSNWLRLSERVFMNASFKEGNWRDVDGREPSVWATAMEDFHELCLTLLRRLVQTVLFVAQSRIKARKVLRPGTKEIVWRRDVESAVASLALVGKSKDFWARCPRRLKLNVLPEDSGAVSEREVEFMSYDEVEAELGLRGRSNGQESTAAIDPDVEVGDTSDSDVVDEELELAEDHVLSVGDKRKAHRQVETQQQREEDAAMVDEQVSCREEMVLWEMMGMPAPDELKAKADMASREGQREVFEEIGISEVGSDDGTDESNMGVTIED